VDEKVDGEHGGPGGLGVGGWLTVQGVGGS
jgi:hypothetical protein